MIRRIAAFAAAAVAALAIAWLLHRRPGEPGSGDGGSASRDSAAAKDSATREASAEAKPDPSKLVANPAKRRGLWLLPPDPNATPLPEHPWLDYIRKRDAVRATWAAAKVSLQLDDVSLSTLQGSFGASSGLVLKLDPAVAAINQGVTFRIQDLAADQGLTLLAMASGTRATVGADGFMWLVPAEGRAACEPAFAQDLARWERGRTQLWPPRTGAAGHLKEALETPRRLSLVQVPLADAIDQIEREWDVRIRSSLWNDSRKPGDPGEQVPATADRPAHDPSQTPVTLVRESVTLLEALRELIAAEDLLMFIDASSIDLYTKAESEDESSFYHDRKIDSTQEDVALVALRDTVVRLDGTPLTAEQILLSTAQQAGFTVMTTPSLSLRPERWEAVEAELKVSEVLYAVFLPTAFRFVFKPEGWPDPVPEPHAAWRLWCDDSWAAPYGVK